MKKLIYIIAFFMLNACVPLKMVNINEPFVKVYDNLDGTKSELFLKANDWMIKTFIKANSIIEYSDKDEGALIGKYCMNGEEKTDRYGTLDTRIFAKIDIRVKDSKVRLSIEPFPWRYDSTGTTIFKYSTVNAMIDMNALANDFQQYLKSKKVDF